MPFVFRVNMTNYTISLLLYANIASSIQGVRDLWNAQSEIHVKVTKSWKASETSYCWASYEKISHVKHELSVPVAARSKTARMLRLRVRIPLGEWISVCCECCVFSGRGLCGELIIRPEQSYRGRCVVVCDLRGAFKL